METTQLISSGFWESDACHVMANDRDIAAVRQAGTIARWCEQHDDLRGHVCFATSGSTGDGKWVALSRQALLASARAVNQHLGVTENDHWLLALPTFHVGGMGIVARAYVAGCALSADASAWNARRFHARLGEGVTLTSLVPTQLMDLVSARLAAPDSLRVALVGGGALQDDVYQKAVDLGWPVVETYGMTEASSQVATATVSDRKLKVLPCWETKTDELGVLSIKGAPLLSGYLKLEHGEVKADPALKNGWFATSDRVEIIDGALVFHGRSDRCVKVLGELVDLEGVESRLQELLGKGRVAVVAVPDQRRGSRLFAIAEGTAGAREASEALDVYHQECIPVARVESLALLDELPRTALGKIRYAALIDRFCDDKIE